MKSVVQFGAGNIGRGFMGQLFTEAGYEVVFVDVIPEIVAGLNERRSYPLRLTGPDRFDTLTIDPVRAVDGRDVEAVARELAASDFACTAVGVPALAHIVPALAAGIRERERPLNVILCENQLHCSDLVRGLLAKHLDESLLNQVGLVESVVSRMVPVVPDEERRRDPLIAIAEDYSRLPVDRRGFLGEIPAVPGLVPVENFSACFDQKLYLHNMGHAVTAYLGFQRGCEFIYQAIGIPDVRTTVSGALAETSEALSRKHGLERSHLRDHWLDLLRRFGNAALGDTVFRVGRDPIRKLRPEDRLTGAALTCLDHDVEPVNIVHGIVAALRFAPEEDPRSQEMQALIREHGVEGALPQLTGQRTDSELGCRIMAVWGAARTGG